MGLKREENLKFIKGYISLIAQSKPFCIQRLCLLRKNRKIDSKHLFKDIQIHYIITTEIAQYLIKKEFFY